MSTGRFAFAPPSGAMVPPPLPKIFCDLDGVLVDFNAGVQRELGRHPQDLSPSYMWSRLGRLRKGGGFYSNLEWTTDGKELWKFILPYQPTILTGLPRGNWAANQKRNWCARELGPSIPVVTCWSRDKHLHCKFSGSILIDDRIELQNAWVQKGGTFVHHTSAKQSMILLKQLLVLPMVSEDDCAPRNTTTTTMMTTTTRSTSTSTSSTTTKKTEENLKEEDK